MRRLALAVATLAGIILAVFFLSRLVPGDPASALSRFSGRSITPAQAAQVRQILGLDRPLQTQIAAWFGKSLRLDFGRSFVDHRPVSTKICEALPFTVELNALALLLTLLIGIPLGVAQARRARSPFDSVLSGGLFALYSMPSFWLAMLLLTLFSVHWRWLPLFGVASDNVAQMGAAARVLDWARHITLPLVCLTYGSLAYFTRIVRGSVLTELSRPYVLAARARGAGDSEVAWRYAFRNALLPIITLTGLLLPGLLSGSVIIEQIFAWPGLGRLFFSAITARDYPVILGMTFFIAAATLLAMIATDLAYAVADPRIRYE